MTSGGAVVDTVLGCASSGEPQFHSPIIRVEGDGCCILHGSESLRVNLQQWQVEGYAVIIANTALP